MESPEFTVLVKASERSQERLQHKTQLSYGISVLSFWVFTGRLYNVYAKAEVYSARLNGTAVAESFDEARR
jgi:hypothetical protein